MNLDSLITAAPLNVTKAKIALLNVVDTFNDPSPPFLPTGVYELKDNDKNHLDVFMVGRTSRFCAGIIEAFKVNARIKYRSHRGSFEETENLIVTTKCISQKGDSGAILFTMDYMAIGMLIADDSESKKSASYFVPITTILKNLKCDLIMLPKAIS